MFFILHSCVPRIYTESVKSSSSTDSSSDPGTNAVKYIKAYTGAGSKTRLLLPDETSTSSTDEEISAFWRKGQPPRGIMIFILFLFHILFFRQINLYIN